MKRTPLDAATSDLVRERADWTCERCEEVDHEGQAKGKSMRMQCSHVYGRKHNSTRYELDNLFCLCATCHAYLETRPIEHAAFARSKLGDVRFEWLQQKHYQVKKWPKHEKEEARKFYIKQYKEIRESRMDGISGYVEAVNYE